MTEDERRIIEVLINYPRTADAWEEPIHAVAKAMGWQPSHANEVVEEMVRRKLLQPSTVARNGTEPMKSEWWWEKFPGAD